MDVLTSEIKHALVQVKGDPRGAARLLLEIMSGPKFTPKTPRKAFNEQFRRLEQTQKDTQGGRPGTSPLMRLAGRDFSKRIMQPGGARDELDKIGGVRSKGFQWVMKTVNLSAFVKLAEEAQLDDAAVYELYKDNIIGKRLNRYPHFFPLATDLYGKDTDLILTLEEIRLIASENSKIRWRVNFYKDAINIDLPQDPATPKDAEFFVNANLETDIVPMIEAFSRTHQGAPRVHWEPGAAFVYVSTSRAPPWWVVVKPGENLGDALERSLLPLQTFPYDSTSIRLVHVLLFEKAWHFPAHDDDDDENFFSFAIQDIGNVEEARSEVVEWSLHYLYSANAAMRLGRFSTWDELKTFVIDNFPEFSSSHTYDKTYVWFDQVLGKYDQEYEAWDDSLKLTIPQETYERLRPTAVELNSTVRHILEYGSDEEKRDMGGRLMDFWVDEAKGSQNEVYDQRTDYKQYKDWFEFYSLPATDSDKALLATQYYELYYPHLKHYKEIVPVYLKYREELAVEEILQAEEEEKETARMAAQRDALLWMERRRQEEGAAPYRR